MLRRFRTVLIFIALGAMVNVAVALASAHWNRDAHILQEPFLPVASDNDAAIWRRHVGPIARDELLAVHSRRCGYELCAIYSDVQGSDLVIIRSGWPLFVLQGEFVGSGGRRTSADQTQRYSLWWKRLDQSPLPLRPIWPGFAINTLFYAVILWVMLSLPFIIRRRLRIRHGLCSACAYPIGTSPVCTECGRAVTQCRTRAHR